MKLSTVDYYTESVLSEHTYEWLLNKHYARRIPSISFAFGLFQKKTNELVGVCTYGKPASNQLCEGVCGVDKKELVYELSRLCVNGNLPRNTLSYFVANTFKLLPKPLILVSYADSGQNHHGYIYQATNWLYTGATKERTDIGTEEGKHPRHYDKDQDYSINRKTRTSKYRYIMFLGTKTAKKKLRERLKYKEKPYPKGDNKKYDANYRPSTQGRLF